MYGQLGHGSNNNEILPRQVMELMGSTVTQVYYTKYRLVHHLFINVCLCYIKYFILRSHAAKDIPWHWYHHKVEFMLGAWVVQAN